VEGKRRAHTHAHGHRDEMQPLSFTAASYGEADEQLRSKPLVLSARGEPSLQLIPPALCPNRQVLLRWGLEKGCAVIPKCADPAHLIPPGGCVSAASQDGGTRIGGVRTCTREHSHMHINTHTLHTYTRTHAPTSAPFYHTADELLSWELPQGAMQKLDALEDASVKYCWDPEGIV